MPHPFSSLVQDLPQHRRIAAQCFRRANTPQHVLEELGDLLALGSFGLSFAPFTRLIGLRTLRSVAQTTLRSANVARTACQVLTATPSTSTVMTAVAAVKTSLFRTTSFWNR